MDAWPRIQSLDHAQRRRRQEESRLTGLELALKIFESPIPVVVGCTGHAIAAGTLLLMAADHVIVGDQPVKIGLNETTIGIELSPFVLELPATDSSPPRTTRYCKETSTTARLHGWLATSTRCRVTRPAAPVP